MGGVVGVGSDVLPRMNDNVFLLETACNTHPRYRDWCAAESWARHNPGLDVWYLFTSLIADDSDNLLTLLLHQYPNLKVATVDLDKIFQDTPLESFFKSDIWRASDSKIFMETVYTLRPLLNS
ncbi:hypothetical protein Pmani_023445 [Petrolisthes manimaculis]|uniref:Uncharacterized protein n=1 Tax=Petrolisthes manimaculis TaxID=1843537 RepID=A0AAE1U381_9EUCA|nr:hypothetical protein Pmani_023445 [Petrolisthes manimaculis]